MLDLSDKYFKVGIISTSKELKKTIFKKLKENKTIKTKQIETLSREADTFLKNQMSGWVPHLVKQLIDSSSGHDHRDMRLSPISGSMLSIEPASSFFSPSPLSTPCLSTHSLS